MVNLRLAITGILTHFKTKVYISHLPNMNEIHNNKFLKTYSLSALILFAWPMLTKNLVHV